MRTKASMTSNMIFWLGVLLATIILFYWYLSVGISFGTKINEIENEVVFAQRVFNDMCNSVSFETVYRPQIRNAFFSVNMTKVCVQKDKSVACKPIFCDAGEYIFDLEEVTDIKIVKEDDSVSILEI